MAYQQQQRHKKKKKKYIKRVEKRSTRWKKKKLLNIFIRFESVPFNRLNIFFLFTGIKMYAYKIEYFMYKNQ